MNLLHIRIILSFICLSFFATSFSQWTELNTGINDDLTGIVFKVDTGAVSGHNGVYYTLTGGATPASWQRLSISGNTADSTIYERTRFEHCLRDNWMNYYACGEDTVENRPVILKFRLSNPSASIHYYGNYSAGLNNLGFGGGSSTVLHAVGSNGLIVAFDDNGVLGIDTSFQSLSYTGVYVQGTGLTIAAGDRLATAGFTGSDYITGELLHPTTNLVDLTRYSSDTWIVGDGYYRGTSSLYESSYYHYGPLNANCIMKRYSSGYMVGTDHGIFSSPAGNDEVLEYEPSSMGYNITEIWEWNHLFACGDNGVVLKSPISYRETEPFVDLIADGACDGQSEYIQIINGSSTSCSWYIDGVLNWSNCSSQTHVFPGTGNYEIKIVVDNGYFTDSIVKSIWIVEEPVQSINYTLSDSVLCYQDTITVQLDTSQTDYSYHLKMVGSGTNFSPQYNGSNSSLDMYTDVLDEVGPYYVFVQSDLANCSATLLDTFELVVEQTVSGFHCSKVNVNTNESVKFFETSTDAQNFLWQFSPNASVLTSNDENPIIQYYALGSTDVTLISWSDYGCYDTITGIGPNVLSNTISPDSCWYSRFDHRMPSISPDQHGIQAFEPYLNGGYLMSGSINNAYVPSKFGIQQSLDTIGSYLARYDKDGILKWWVFTESEFTYDNIDKIDIDNSGDIAIAGYSKGYIHDNSGNQISISNTYDFNTYVAVLDSLGKLKWNIAVSGMLIYGIQFDNNGELIVQASVNFLGQSYKVLELNGVALDTLQNFNPNANFVMFKLDQTGRLVWQTDMYYWYSTTNSIKVDDQNNIYTIGEVHATAEFNSASSGNVEAFNCINCSFSQYHGFLVKHSSDGNVLWMMTSGTTGANSLDVLFKDLEVDADGTCYIAGRNENRDSLTAQLVYNTDGSITTYPHGCSFLMKVNNQGVCQWVHGTDRTYNGLGLQVERIDDDVFLLGDYIEGFTYVYPNQAVFLGSDSTNVQVSASYGDFFIANWDTSGVIKCVINSADLQPGEIPLDLYETKIDFFTNDGQEFFISGNSNTLANGPSRDIFNMTIDSIGNYASFVFKIEKECGFEFCPEYIKQDTINILCGEDFTNIVGTTFSNISQNFTDTVNVPYVAYYDSIYITSIIIDSLYDDTISVQICNGGSYTFPDGLVINNLNNDTLHTSYLSNLIGCDSTIHTSLIVVDSFYVSDSVNICSNQSYTFPDGFTITNLTADVDHSSYFTSSIGCDSIIYTYVHVLGAIVVQELDTVCQGSSYTFPDGTTINNITSSYTHQSNLTGSIYCDSTVETSLYVEQLTPSVNVIGSQITALPSGYNYQWLNCDSSYSVIPGDTNQIFNSVQSGNYACEIQGLVCVDTSNCVFIDHASLDEFETGISIYPNPFESQIILDVGDLNGQYELKISDSQGKICYQESLFIDNKISIHSELPSGIYYFEIRKGNQSTVKIICKE